MVNWHLLANEKKIHHTTMSRKVFLKYYVLGMVLAVLGVTAFVVPFVMGDVLPVSPYAAGVVLLVLSAVPIGIGEWRKRREMILITTERVLVRKLDEKSGGVNIEAIPFDKLTNVRVRQSRMQRVMNIGDVVFVVVSEEHVLKDIDSPYMVERAVYKIIEKEKERGM